MNYGIVLKVLGSILIIEALLMVPSYVIALFTHGNDAKAFLITIILTTMIGIILAKRKVRTNKISARDGFAIVTFGWLLASLLGALPLYLPRFTNTYIDALFETVSGFTTTGATILANVEALPRGILFWRSFTHWIGGMGILVFTLALLPALGIQGFQIYKAESWSSGWENSSKTEGYCQDFVRYLYSNYTYSSYIIGSWGYEFV